MSERINSLLDRAFHKRVLRRWNKLVDRAEAADLSALRKMRSRAREIRRRLDEVLHIADARLTLPLVGTNAIVKPLHSDWAWRPQLWRGPVSPPGIAAVQTRTTLGGEATVFHDCTITELTFRQIRNTREEDLAPFGLRMDVFRFDGSFLSLAIDLPAEAVEGLQRRHLLRLSMVVEMEQPLEIFARLNVRHGPNTEQIVRELPLNEVETMVEFDLAYTNMNEKRVERAWIDLIFENPEMNQIVIRDLTLARRPRAEI